MSSQGVRIRPGVDLAEQMPRLPRNFFDYYLKAGELDAREAAEGGAAGAGGGGLIEEEPDQVQQQMPQPHEAWHVVQQR